MKITSYSFLSMILILFYSGCRYDSIDKIKPIPENTFPNKVGNTWIYQVDDTTFLGGYGSDTVMKHTRYTVSVAIIDSVIYHGRKGNIWAYNSPVWRDTNYVFQNMDTLHFYDITYSQFPEMERQYILPLVLRKSWDYFSGWDKAFDPDSYDTVMVTDVQNNFSLGQNNYCKTFHISGNLYIQPDIKFSIDEWICVGVGLTKRRFASNYAKLDFQKHITWSLVSYNVQ